MVKINHPRDNGGIHIPRDGRTNLPDKFGMALNGSFKVLTKRQEDGKTTKRDRSGINLAESGNSNGTIQITADGRFGVIQDVILIPFLLHTQNVLHTKDVFHTQDIILTQDADFFALPIQFTNLNGFF